MARVAIFSILERTKLLMPPGALGEWVGYLTMLAETQIASFTGHWLLTGGREGC